MRALAKDLTVKSGKVQLAGWVNSRRDHGGLIFIDLRDHQGIIQLVVTPENTEAFKLAESVRDEFVLTATGTMRVQGHVRGYISGVVDADFDGFLHGQLNATVSTDGEVNIQEGGDPND